MSFAIVDWGRTRARGWAVPLVLALGGVWGWACQDSEPDGSEDGMDGTGDGHGSCDLGADADEARRRILESIANNVMVPSTIEFADRATALHGATTNLVEAVTVRQRATSDAADPWANAQAAWGNAMQQWQLLEVMQIGPAAPSVSGIAGENMRDQIYSWPTIDTCRVDRAIADESYTSEDFFVNELVYAFGLDALEYLLFVHDSRHTCPPQVQLDPAWTALGSEEIERRRAAYANVLAAHVEEWARRLAARWSPDGDDFARALAHPGEGDSPYEGEAQALDDVFRAMFYVDLKTKDAKLARALGLSEGCTSAPCPDLLESPHAQQAAPWVQANLEGLRTMVQGGFDPAESDGFDDLLREVDAGDMADRLLEDLEAAIAEAESIEDPLQQVLVTDPERVTALHSAIKKVTDTLKGPFVMCLMLTVPKEASGDAD